MSNLNTYLEKRGGLKLDAKHPFNEIDAMVLARISYLPFDKILLGRKETIYSVCSKMSQLSAEDFRWPDDVFLVSNLMESVRFRGMRIIDYVKNNSVKAERQFSAVTILMNRREMYLSYFGTDDSIIGWKEDFNLAILDRIPAQIEGAKYLRFIRICHPFRKIYLGGHSKGGNVAMFATIMAPDRLQKKILGVYNFDGPGLRAGTEALDKGSEKILPKIQSFIPQDSIIGRLFEHREKFTVVKSNSKNLYQHDIYSWEVRGNNFVRSESTKASDMTDKTITDWLESATMSEKKIFIDGMFKIFDSAKVKNPIDFKKNWIRYAPILFKSFVNTSKRDRKIILKVWKKLGKSFLKARKENK